MDCETKVTIGPTGCPDETIGQNKVLQGSSHYELVLGNACKVAACIAIIFPCDITFEDLLLPSGCDIKNFHIKLDIVIFGSQAW